MIKGEELIRRLGSPTAREEIADSAGPGLPIAVAEQVKTQVSPRTLDAVLLAKGLALLAKSDAASRATLVTAPVPVLFYEMPSSLRAGDVVLERLLLIYWGWETHFGGSLTITVVASTGVAIAVSYCA